MKRSRLTALTALAAAGAIALSACTRAEPPAEPDDPAQGTNSVFEPGFFEKDAPAEPTDGGTLTVADYAEARTLDPSRAIATGYSGGSSLIAVYDQLVRWNQRDQAFENRLAESVEPNDDYTEWTITLRKDAKFSDGTPVNADAVIGSFNYYIQNKGFDLGVVGSKWGGAEKVDDTTVKVKLRESWATFPFALGMGMGFIVAPAAIEGGPDNFKPIGAGAFTYESYKPQEELVLAANPNFWEGKPHLDKLRFVWVGADETKYDSLTSNSVQVAVIRDLRMTKQSREADHSGWLTIESLGNIIQVNQAQGRPGSDPAVSKAIAHAINEEELYDRVFDGLGLPTKRLFPPGSVWHNEDVEAPEFDPEQAKKYLEEAKGNGFDGTVKMISLADPISRDQGLTLQAQLEAAGFKVENDFVRTVTDITTKIHIERDFDFARTALAINDADPYWRLYSGFHSKSPANAYGYADDEFDALLEELQATPVDERADVLKRVEERFLSDLPAITFAGNVTFIAWQQNVHGVQPTNDAMVGFEKAWIAN
ncbi:ABC transporter substrate-binding protein [Enemella sp. A6]|uniref:ABC transporter substrate-binding protein n=1 Tax=Enemella sp. A6 TaxID=3440152 RepID=UPI003EBDAEE0